MDRGPLRGLFVKISTKISVFFVCILLIFAGLAVTLLGEIKSISAGYDALLQGPVRQADAARVAQIDFKKQVQEWKDILLRGHNAEDLAKYTKQFHERETAVKTQALTLVATIEDPKTKQLLNDFLAADEKLSAKYQEAYEAFLSRNFDFSAADKLVRGQDRVPTDLFDQVVAQLNDQVAARVAAQQNDASRRRDFALLLAAALLGLVSVIGFIVVRGILSRLGRLKAVSDRLALADISGLVIDISGNDEVGAFGESMKGVAAAIAELLSLAESKPA
jgi:methyl-accepting chemotaxis protein